MKAARRPLFWFNFTMWILSVVISALLIQLGSLIMSDVPTAGNRITQSDFVDAAQLHTTNANIDAVRVTLAQNANDLEDAAFLLNSRSMDYQNQRASFENWLQTRNATASDDQNPEVVTRVKEIEQLKLAERDAERTIETLEQNAVQENRRLRSLQVDRQDIDAAALAPYEKARNFEVLKVFMLRLALTLPLLLVSAWLVLKKRRSNYWPIYRGFVLFSLFAFFVELVPYMPSYGGYVRTIVGIGLTLIFAHFAIKGMKRYVETKQDEETRPETEKRKLIGYETAVKKISTGICPSCDRQFGAEKSRKITQNPDPKVDFCVHCGFCLFNNCTSCGERENSFYKFCGACGVPSQDPADPT